MEEIIIDDSLSILNFGAKLQNKISTLADSVSDASRESKVEEAKKLILDFLNKKNAAPDDQLIQELKQMNIVIQKECEFFRQMKLLNDSYIVQMNEYVAYIGSLKSTRALQDRASDLKISLVVAQSLVPQIEMSEDNSSRIAGRLQSVLKNVVTLMKTHPEYEY